MKERRETQGDLARLPSYQENSFLFFSNTCVANEEAVRLDKKYAYYISRSIRSISITSAHDQWLLLLLLCFIDYFAFQFLPHSLVFLSLPSPSFPPLFHIFNLFPLPRLPTQFLSQGEARPQSQSLNPTWRSLLALMNKFSLVLTFF